MTERAFNPVAPGFTYGMYGEFLPRFFAWLIDGIITGILTQSVLFLAKLFPQEVQGAVTFVLICALIYFYFVYLVRNYGFTPGKRLLHLKITDLEGRLVNYTQAWLRYFPYILLGELPYIAKLCGIDNKEDDKTAFFAILLVNFLWFVGSIILLVVNKQNRTIHDFMAKTVVVIDPANPPSLHGGLPPPR